MVLRSSGSGSLPARWPQQSDRPEAVVVGCAPKNEPVAVASAEGASAEASSPGAGTNGIGAEDESEKPAIKIVMKTRKSQVRGKVKCYIG